MSHVFRAHVADFVRLRSRTWHGVRQLSERPEGTLSAAQKHKGWLWFYFISFHLYQLEHLLLVCSKSNHICVIVTITFPFLFVFLYRNSDRTSSRHLNVLFCSDFVCGSLIDHVHWSDSPSSVCVTCMCLIWTVCLFNKIIITMKTTHGVVIMFLTVGFIVKNDLQFVVLLHLFTNLVQILMVNEW